MIVPERWETAEVLQKNPRQLRRADAPAGMAQGLQRGQNGAVTVDSSQEKSARMRVNPVVVVSYPG